MDYSADNLQFDCCLCSVWRRCKRLYSWDHFHQRSHPFCWFTARVAKEGWWGKLRLNVAYFRHCRCGAGLWMIRNCKLHREWRLFWFYPKKRGQFLLLHGEWSTVPIAEEFAWSLNFEVILRIFGSFVVVESVGILLPCQHLKLQSKSSSVYLGALATAFIIRNYYK